MTQQSTDVTLELDEAIADVAAAIEYLTPSFQPKIKMVLEAARATLSQPVGEVCRQAFENWVTDNKQSPKAGQKDSTGNYTLMQTYMYWTAWQEAWVIAHTKGDKA